MHRLRFHLIPILLAGAVAGTLLWRPSERAHPHPIRRAPPAKFVEVSPPEEPLAVPSYTEMRTGEDPRPTPDPPPTISRTDAETSPVLSELVAELYSEDPDLRSRAAVEIVLRSQRDPAARLLADGIRARPEFEAALRPLPLHLREGWEEPPPTMPTDTPEPPEEEP